MRGARSVTAAMAIAAVLVIVVFYSTNESNLKHPFHHATVESNPTISSASPAAAHHPVAAAAPSTAEQTESQAAAAVLGSKPVVAASSSSCQHVILLADGRSGTDAVSSSVVSSSLLDYCEGDPTYLQVSFTYCASFLSHYAASLPCRLWLCCLPLTLCCLSLCAAFSHYALPVQKVQKRKEAFMVAQGPITRLRLDRCIHSNARVNKRTYIHVKPFHLLEQNHYAIHKMRKRAPVLEQTRSLCSLTLCSPLSALLFTFDHSSIFHLPLPCSSRFACVTGALSSGVVIDTPEQFFIEAKSAGFGVVVTSFRRNQLARSLSLSLGSHSALPHTEHHLLVCTASQCALPHTVHHLSL